MQDTRQNPYVRDSVPTTLDRDTLWTLQARPSVGPKVGRRPSAENYARIAVRPLNPHIGAEITGSQGPLALVDLDDATFEEIHRAWLDWKVVFFRDQFLTQAQQVAFCRRFGDLEIHPTFRQADGQPELTEFAKDENTKGIENLWHYDVTFRAQPSKAGVLNCVVAPSVGGDTLFADMEAAYETLPDIVKDAIEGKTATHRMPNGFMSSMPLEQQQRLRAEFPDVHHPLVRTHPETGRKALFANGAFVVRMDGVDKQDGDALHAYLCSRAGLPEFQCRWQWRAGDLALWDNRCSQHYASSDYYPARRVMHRASIVGDRPV